MTQTIAIAHAPDRDPARVLATRAPNKAAPAWDNTARRSPAASGTASGRRLGLNTDCARSNGGEGGAKILSGQARLLLRAHNRGLKAAKSLSQVQTRARPSPRDDFSRRTAKPATMRLCPLPNAVWGAKSLDVVVEPASLPGYLVPLA